MSSDMEVDSVDNEVASIALHPLSIVHMSDQFTRVTCGGSPLPRDAPVVGLLFGSLDDAHVLQIRDADDIPTEITDATKTQVDLHRAVFPQHSVVGWYRVSSSAAAVVDVEPILSDLATTQALKSHYAPTSSAFCFCLLHVQDQDKDDGSTKKESMIEDELPINLYELNHVHGTPVLVALSNWQLETSDPERIAVERVMKEQPPEAAKINPYTSQLQSVQHSLLSMSERIQILVTFLEQTQQGIIPPNHGLLRKVQGLLYSLGPLSCSAQVSGPVVHSDAQLLSHLAIMAKTVHAVQSYTDKFRVVHEKRKVKEMRGVF